MTKRVLGVLVVLAASYGTAVLIWLMYLGIVTRIESAGLIPLTPLRVLGVLGVVVVIVAIAIEEKFSISVRVVGICVLGLSVAVSYFAYLGVLSILSQGVWGGSFLDVIGTVVLGFIGWATWETG